MVTAGQVVVRKVNGGKGLPGNGVRGGKSLLLTKAV